VSSDLGVNTFSYLDYRVLLRVLFEQKKARGTGFSHRAFSRRAGFRSTNYLHLVLSGKRNLTADGARRFARGFGMNTEETSYFCELVRFNQAKTAEDRAAAYERLGKFRKFRKAHKLLAAQRAYHSTWYLPAIRELAAREDFRDDAAWIAKMLIPPIAAAEARRAVSRLVELGLLVRSPDGALRRQTELVTTGAGPLGHEVVQYHRAMMDRASEAIDRVARDEREISSVTLCVSHDVLLQLKERIRTFRRELLQFAELEGKPERAVQINFQLFPLSKRGDGSDA
jgi:uncharacterized protein (TIGR02147 family)